MTHSNADLLRRWFDEVWNQGRPETIDELMCEDCEIQDLVAGEARGLDGFKSFTRQLRTAIPDIRIAVEDSAVDGDTVATRWRATGTHTGEGLGPPSGARIAVDGMSFVHVEGGRVKRAWDVYDRLALLRQIGLIPAG